MARRPKMPSLGVLTRAYQRNMRSMARLLQLSAAPKAKAAAKRLPKRATPLVPSAPLSARKPIRISRQPALGQWVSGIAPGPAGARRYQLYVPPGVSRASRTRLPLLVMLHGCGQTANGFAATTRMNQRAVRERFLVLYPEQERVANAQGCWNWFARRNGRADAEAATLLAAIDQVAERYPVHPARIGVAGLSAGASMAGQMALLAPQRFCAVAMHSGAPPGSAESAATALAAMRGDREPHRPETGDATVTPCVLPPLLLLHGDADGVVALQSARRTAAWWADALGARPGPVRVQQRGARRATHVTEWRARSKVQVVLREIDGLGHAWSGGAARTAYSDPSGPDATALIWAFMARQFDVVAPSSKKQSKIH